MGRQPLGNLRANISSQYVIATLESNELSQVVNIYIDRTNLRAM
jgi:hypothetical protein